MSRISTATAARVGGILTGAGVLFVGGVLIASAPAFADNGPHITYQGTTAIQNGPDGCAGCHRLHSAQGSTNLLVNASEEALCATCHENGAGATTDVINGVQYKTAGTPADGTVGALRGGGFSNAMLDAGNASRGGVYWNASRSSWSIDKTGLLGSNTPGNKIGVGAASKSTSSHAMGANSTMWGSGAVGSGVGTGVTLECGSCHDPHGNGNYRILRPYGTLGKQTIVAPSTVLSVKVAADADNAGKFAYTFTTTAAHGLTPGQPISITGSVPAGYNVSTTSNGKTNTVMTVASVPSTTEFVIVNQATDPGPLTTGGTVYQAWPNTIKSITGAGTGTLTITTWQAHGLVSGQKVSIAGTNPASYATSAPTAITVTSTTVFTIPSAVTAAYVGGGYISGIPDALESDATKVDAGYTVTGTTKKVYNTLNYWRVDDHNYTGVTVNPTVNAGSAVVGSSAFIANTSQWCTTCHTRYLADSSTARTTKSGDSLFTYRHTSGAKVEDSPSCMQCHVAHGSNAIMDGQFSKALKDPSGATPATTTVGNIVSGDSRLLRANNRGICIMCHNM